MKNIKATFLIIFTVFLSVCFANCDGKKSQQESISQKPYVKTQEDTTYEDGGRAQTAKTATKDNENRDQKDSATVGPTAPKAPPLGGRAQ